MPSTAFVPPSSLADTLVAAFVAILSTPLFSYFGDQQLNVWITYPPFVWLPSVMVLAALTGHILIFRRLLATTV